MNAIYYRQSLPLAFKFYCWNHFRRLPGHGWCNIKMNVDHLISSVCTNEKCNFSWSQKTIAWTNIIRNPFTRAGRNLGAPLHISSKASILYSVSGGESKPALVFWIFGADWNLFFFGYLINSIVDFTSVCKSFNLKCWTQLQNQTLFWGLWRFFA